MGTISPFHLSVFRPAAIPATGASPASTALPGRQPQDVFTLKAPRFGEAFPDHIRGVDRDCVPTPATLAQTMIDAVGLKQNMDVLEPSAGTGNIAEEIQKTQGIRLDVAEFKPELRKRLQQKGFRVVGSDFLALDTRRKRYDRILMNPPFSQAQAAIHIQHAYDMLKPGGRIAAILPDYWFTGQTRKNKQFRNWLKAAAPGFKARPLPAEVFDNSESETRVKTRLLTLEKPKKPPKISEDLRLDPGCDYWVA